MSARRHVLIVDDEPQLRALLEVSLGRRGWTCASSEDPVGAIRILESGAVTHALVDVHLGAHSGLDLLRTISARWPDVWLVAMSGASVGTGPAALLAGAALFLAKPLTSLRTISDALEGVSPAEEEEDPSVLSG